MASARPIKQQLPGRTARLPLGHRRARFLVVCALIAVAIGVIVAGASRHGPAVTLGTAITDRSVIATPLPNVLTPTPLANTPAPTAPPTAIPLTSAPPRVVAPLVQPAPANVAPSKPHDDGKGKGKGKDD